MEAKVDDVASQVTRFRCRDKEGSVGEGHWATTKMLRPNGTSSFEWRQSIRNENRRPLVLDKRNAREGKVPVTAGRVQRSEKNKESQQGTNEERRSQRHRLEKEEIASGL